MKQAVIFPCSILLVLLAFPKLGFPGILSSAGKKSILTTEGDSISPRTVHKKYDKLKLHSDDLVLKALVERAENAVKALKKLEAYCNNGISKQDFTRTLGETEFEVNMFVGSNGANHFHELKASIIKTMQFYIKINDYLELSELEAGIRRQQGKELDADHIEKKFQELIDQSFFAASQELSIVSQMLND